MGVVRKFKNSQGIEGGSSLEITPQASSALPQIHQTAPRQMTVHRALQTQSEWSPNLQEYSNDYTDATLTPPCQCHCRIFRGF